MKRKRKIFSDSFYFPFLKDIRFIEPLDLTYTFEKCEDLYILYIQYIAVHTKIQRSNERRSVTEAPSTKKQHDFFFIFVLVIIIPSAYNTQDNFFDTALGNNS